MSNIGILHYNSTTVIINMPFKEDIENGMTKPGKFRLLIICWAASESIKAQWGQG